VTAHISLVTGGAGFIASHLVRRLVAKGDRVHVVVRETTRLDRIADLIDKLTIHRLDLADANAVFACLSAARPDRVFHLAAETRSGRSRGLAAARKALSHVGELLNLLDAMVALPEPPSVLVRAGTIAEYGAAPVPYEESQRERPLNPYGASMVAATRQLGMLEDVLPFPAITARLALIYGPAQSEDFLVPALIRSCLEGRQTTVRHPNDRRDLLYVGDAVNALLTLAESSAPGVNLLNVSSGVAPTMREVAELVLLVTGANPRLVEFGSGDSDLGISELRASPVLARLTTGWTATTGLEDGIALTVAAMKRTLELQDGGTF
jgi:UDP-glucose 4-epimerase